MQTIKKVKLTAAVIICIMLVFAFFKAFDSETSGYMPDTESVIDITAEDHKENEDGTHEWSYIFSEEIKSPVIAVENRLYPITITLDDELIYSVSSDTTEQGINVKWIYLPENIEGKTLRVVSNSTNIGVYAGSTSDIVVKYTNENFGGFIGVLSTGIIAVVLLVVFFVLRKDSAYGGNKSLVYLAGYILMSVAWSISDCTGARLLTDHVEAVTMCSYFSLILMPYFFNKYIESYMEKRDLLMRALSILYIVILFVFVIMYITDFMNLRRVIVVQHVIVGVNMLLALWIMARAMRRKKELTIVFVGVLAMEISAVLMYTIYYASSYANYSVVFSVGNLIFIMCLMVVAIRNTRSEIIVASKAQSYRELAYLDFMTKLSNRTAFDARLQKYPEFSGNGSCVVLDLNNLKNTNDTYGHIEGDRLICSLADRIREIYDGTAECYRIGGDEFVVVSDELDEAETRERVAELERRIEELNATENIPLSVSIGCADGKGRTVLETYHAADMEMYENKRIYKAAAAMQA